MLLFNLDLFFIHGKCCGNYWQHIKYWTWFGMFHLSFSVSRIVTVAQTGIYLRVNDPKEINFYFS